MVSLLEKTSFCQKFSHLHVPYSDISKHRIEDICFGPGATGHRAQELLRTEAHPQTGQSRLYILPTLVYDSSSLFRFPVQHSAVFHPLYRGFLPLSWSAFTAACWAVRCKQSKEQQGSASSKRGWGYTNQRKSHIKPQSQTSGGHTKLPQLWQSRLSPLQTRLMYNAIKHPRS